MIDLALHFASIKIRQTARHITHLNSDQLGERCQALALEDHSMFAGTDEELEHWETIDRLAIDADCRFGVGVQIQAGGASLTVKMKSPRLSLGSLILPYCGCCWLREPEITDVIRYSPSSVPVT